MHQEQTYYRDGDDWRKRVHILPDDNSWRRDWPHAFRDDLAITPAGLFIVRREDNYTYSRPATACDAVAFFAPPPSGKRGGGVQLSLKVPFSLLRVAHVFFQAVWAKHEREDVLLLYVSDTTQRYRLTHPNLKSASSSHVDYEVPVTPTNWTRFGSLHSHGHEGAYHSATDARDDVESPGLHIIVGSLESQLPTLHCIFSHDGYCFGVPASDVFYDDKRNAVTFPDGWMLSGVPAGPRPARVYPSSIGDKTSVSRTNQYPLSESSPRQPPSAGGDWLGGD